MENGRLLGGSHVECDKCHLENDPLLNREPVKLISTTSQPNMAATCIACRQTESN